VFGTVLSGLRAACLCTRKRMFVLLTMQSVNVFAFA